MKNVGRRLRILRERLKLSQTEVASRARLTQPCVSQLESARSNPRLDTLVKLGRALGFDVVWKPK